MMRDVSPGAMRTVLAAVIAVGLVAVFVLDASMPRGHDGAAYYVALVFLAVLRGRTVWVVVTAGISCAGAVIAGFFKTDPAMHVTLSEYTLDRFGVVALIVASGVIGYVVVVRTTRLLDVSRRLTEVSATVEEQLHFLRAASRVGKLAGWSLAFAGDRTIAWSEDAQQLLGIGQGFSTADGLSLFDDADVKRLTNSIAAVERDGMPFVETFRITALDGRRLWVNVMGEPALDDAKRVAGVRGAIQDVTAWKEAEAAAAIQQSRFTNIANAVPAIIWTADVEGAIDYFNDALVEYSGRDASDLYANGWLAILHDDDVDACVSRWQYSVATGEPYEISFRIRAAGGEYRWFHVRASAERNAAGNIVRWWGSAIDVHELTLLEAEASTLARERDEILESIGDGVFTLDPGLHFTYLNGNAEKLLRRPASELLGRNVWELFPEANEEEVRAAFAHEGRGDGLRITYHNPVIDAWFDINASRTERGITVFFRDITEFKSISEQLAQAQRMESVGRLTGGVAHDFNNLLTVVLGGAEELAQEPSLTNEGRLMVSLIADAANRGADLTHQLLAFSRRQPLAPQPVDVTSLTREMTGLLSRAVGAGVKVEWRLADDLPTAQVDPSQLESAILNLAINASDAMPSGGTLTVETSLAELDEAYSTLHTEVSPGSYVRVSVRDTGAGIPPETLPHVFEPFYTTKPVGQGSGLGLAMVWGFAKQSGGHVTAYSDVGLGTTIHIYLPVAGADEAQERPAPASVIDRGPRSGRVLLADDDPLVRTFAAERLRAAGFDVTVAESGVEALPLLDAMDGLDLLVTDVVMVGGVSGRDLADAVLERFPGTPVLYASGYSKEVIDHHGRLDPDVTLIPKPYTGKQLLERVDEVMARRLTEDVT